MSTPTLYDFVKVPLLLFSIGGIPILKWNPEDKYTAAQIFAILVFLMNLSCNATSKIAFLFFGEINDFKELTLLITYWALTLNGIIKMCMIWLGRNNIKKVFMYMKEIYPSTETQRCEFKLTKYYRRLQRYNHILMTVNIVAVQAFNIVPLIQSLIEYYFSNEANRSFNWRLPYMLYYSFDTTRPVNYILAYFMQWLGATTLELYFLGSDLLLISSVQLLNMFFEYLIVHIENLLPTGTDRDVRELCELMKYHKDILTNCENIDQTFNLSIFLNYIFSGIVICLMAVQIVAGAEKIILIKFALMLICCLVHIYLISLFGTEMIVLSSNISDAFTHHQWYLASIEYQRLLPLPIARAQKPAHLNGFKFFVISMESFQTLVIRSYQFFTFISATLQG